MECLVSAEASDLLFMEILLRNQHQLVILNHTLDSISEKLLRLQLLGNFDSMFSQNSPDILKSTSYNSKVVMYSYLKNTIHKYRIGLKCSPLPSKTYVVQNFLKKLR